MQSGSASTTIEDLLKAIEDGNTEMVINLINRNPQINLDEKASGETLFSAYGWGAIHIGTANGDIGSIEALIKYGANVDLPDLYNNTALHQASTSGRADLVNVLLEAGANFNLVDQDHNTALHFASELGHNEVVKALIGKGANTELANKKGQTPLQVAVKEISKHPKHLITAKLLLKKGADLEKIGKKNELYPLLKVIQKLSNDEIKAIDDHHNIIKKLSDDEIDVMGKNIINLIDEVEDLSLIGKGTKFDPLKNIIDKLSKDEITVIFNHYEILKKLPYNEIKVIGEHLDHFKTISDYLSEMNLQKPRTNLRASTATEVEKRNSRSRT